MQRQFDAILEELLPTQDKASSQAKVLLAVSGGVDSISMANLFLHSSVGFAMAHCNFHLRGQESDCDEAFVREWADKNGVRLHKIDFDTEAFASDHQVSIEMAARELRYRWFASLAKEFGYRAVAVAHNANDNAETLLLNLLRGTGLRGLTNMSDKGDLPFSNGEVMVIRPLLSFTRKQIEGYAMANSLSWREDSTNADSLYKRNKLRNQVFPIFETINPSFIKTLNREMTYFSEDFKIVEQYCSKVAALVSIQPDGSDGPTIIDIKALMDNEIWKPVLYHIMDGFGFNSSMVSSVATLIGRKENIGGRRFVSKDYELLSSENFLIFRPLSLLQNDSCKTSLVVETDGDYDFNGVKFSVKSSQIQPAFGFKAPKGTVMFDADKLGFPFVVRTWNHGDWLRPLGLKGRKKLSDLFTDLKYSPLDKEKALVIELKSKKETDQKDGRSHIAALMGVRIDDSIKLSSSSKRIITITVI